jgi:hypothetical protein
MLTVVPAMVARGACRARNRGDRNERKNQRCNL